METFKQARDLLIWVRDLHRRMKKNYAEAADQASEERSSMAFRFLEQHESIYEQTLTDALSQQQDVLNTWIQYTPDKELLDPFHSYEPSPDMHVQDISQTAQKMSDALLQFFREAVERVKSEPARAVFEQLLKKQESDRAKLAEHLESIHRGV